MALRMLPIARPCSEPFEAMSGDEQTRYCERCEKNVYDLSARTEQEARALLRTFAKTRVCLRYARDTHGFVRFRNAAVAAATALSTAACAQPHNVPPAANPQHVTHEDVYDQGDAIPDVRDACEQAEGAGCDGAVSQDAGTTK